MWASWLLEVSKMGENEPFGLKNVKMHQPPLLAGRWAGQLSIESCTVRMDRHLP